MSIGFIFNSNYLKHTITNNIRNTFANYSLLETTLHQQAHVIDV